MIQRTIESNISKRATKEKIILLFGARQVGKTTLLKMLTKKSGAKTVWLNKDAVVQLLFPDFDSQFLIFM
jgi:hypothetical protein